MIENQQIVGCKTIYKKYKLNDDEISFVESMIKPME